MIVAYTDGGVSLKNKIGGWGVVFVYPDGSRKGIANYEEGEGVTNNTMEMTAVIEALKFIDHNHPGEPLEIVSDSEYVIKGTTEWSVKWRANGWRGMGGRVKNREYWELLLSYTDRMQPTFKWVRGHNGDENNELVDKLCVKAYTDRLTERKTEVN